LAKLVTLRCDDGEWPGCHKGRWAVSFGDGEEKTAISVLLMTA
jgi:hypothetical protein